MAESSRIMLETVFNIVYLIVVWWLVSAMWLRRSLVRPEERQSAELLRWAFFFLGLGDIGHVGFRVVAFAREGLSTTVAIFGTKVLLAPMGSLATAITFTFFYLIMVMLWHARFQKPYGIIGYAVFFIGVARLVIMAMPANNWNSLEPPFAWVIYRNVPLMLMQLLVAYLILRDAFAHQDKAFVWIGVFILVSFLCYAPAIFFQRIYPPVGMLMIPKTIAYLVIAGIGFFRFYRQSAPTASARAEQSVIEN